MSHKYDAAKHTWSYETGELGYMEKPRSRLVRVAGIAAALCATAAVMYVAFWPH